MIYLRPSSAQRFGPFVNEKENSPYSCVIEVDGKRQWCHANHLRNYHDRLTNAVSDSCAIVFDIDGDFGDISSLEI